MKIYAQMIPNTTFHAAKDGVEYLIKNNTGMIVKIYITKKGFSFRLVKRK
jgi:hypothetical protein